MAKMIKHVVGMSLGGCDRAVSSQTFCEAYTIMVKLMEVVYQLEEYERYLPKEDESNSLTEYDNPYECDLLDFLMDCQFATASNVMTYLNRLCPTALS